jgi:hypothetical protein
MATTSPLTNMQAEEEEAAAPEAAAPRAPVRDLVQEQLAKYAENRKTLDAQIDKLKSSLEQRTALPFDPMLMRIAAAAGQPTKTGSMYEGIGNIAGATLDEARKEQDRRSEIEKAKYELALKQYEMQNAGLEQQGFLNFAKSRGMGAQPQGATLIAPPEGASPARSATAGRDQAMTSIAAPPGVERRLTPEDVAELSILSPKFGKIYQDMNASRQKGLVNSEVGIWDSYANNGTGGWLVKYPGAKEVTAPFIGKQTLSHEQWDRVSAAKAELEKKGVPVEQQKRDMYELYVGMGIIGGPSAKAAATGPAGAASKVDIEGNLAAATPEGKDASKIKTTETIKADVGRSATAEDKIQAGADSAQGLKSNAQGIIDLTHNPKTAGAWGLLQKAGDGAAFRGLLVAAKTGFTGPLGLKGQIAAVEDAIRAGSGTQKEKEAALTAATYYAQIELFYTQSLMSKQGSITENERAIVRNIGGGTSDTARVASLKAYMIQNRATFDQIVAKKYYEWKEKNPGKYVADFKNSSLYKDEEARLDKKSKELRLKYFPNDTSAPEQRSSGTGPLEAQLGERS